MSEPAAGVRPDIQRMCDHTKRLRGIATDVFTALSDTQWRWMPDSTAWSAAMIIDHLNSVLTKGLPGIESAIEELRRTGQTSSTEPRYGFIERFFIRLMSPNPPFKVPVPPVFTPNQRAEPAASVGPEFIRLLDRLLECTVAADGLNLTKLKIPSAANERMRMSVGVWLEGITAHNDYHWMQVEALRADPGFPRN